VQWACRGLDALNPEFDEAKEEWPVDVCDAALVLIAFVRACDDPIERVDSECCRGSNFLPPLPCGVPGMILWREVEQTRRLSTDTLCEFLKRTAFQVRKRRPSKESGRWHTPGITQGT
jgi:hypothetical protein